MVSDIVWDPKMGNTPFSAGLRTCKEIVDEIELPVTGIIPPYVVGRLYRNGPGLYELTHKNGEVTHINHWFDGVAVVHRFHIVDGKVTYKNRRTMKEYIEAVESTPSKAVFKSVTFGDQDPCRGVLGTLFQMWRPFTRHPETGKISPNIGVTLERIPNVSNLVSRTDFNRSAVLDIDTLESKRTLSFRHLNPALSGGASAAHGVVDPDTGAYFNYVYEYGPRPEYVVFETNKEETRVLAKFKETPVYIHSIAATKNYVIVMIYSAPMNVLRLLYDSTCLANSIDVKSNMRVKFYVVSRQDAKVSAVFDADPFFCFHNINAFDQDGDVVIDLAKYNDASVIEEVYRSKMIDGKAKSSAIPVRFTISNIAEAAAMYKGDGNAVGILEARPLVNDTDIELPRVPDSQSMRPYQYAYGVSSSGMPAPATIFNSLVKLDVESGVATYYTPADGVCGEPIFVGNPDGTDEDDGVLLSVVLDKAEEKSFMAVVDARTMEEIGRATVPQAVPLGFHGQYMPEELAKGSI